MHPRIIKAVVITSLFISAGFLADAAYQADKNDNFIVKEFRDPQRVDKRWVFVSAMVTAAIFVSFLPTGQKGKSSDIL